MGESIGQKWVTMIMYDPQPETNKEAAVIEKTANFIATHGLQMEIMMKTKQGNNPKFMFMHFEDILHPFYKHVIKMIKSGKYKPKVEEKVKEEEHSEGIVLLVHFPC